jgi:hypothetical protein
LPHSTPKKEKRPFLTVLVEVAGKRGHEQLITLLGDAPDENKESEEAETCEDDEWRLYFRAVGKPSGESPFATFDPQKKKKDRS